PTSPLPHLDSGDTAGPGNVMSNGQNITSSLHCRQPLRDQSLRNRLTKILPGQLSQNRVWSEGLISRLDDPPDSATLSASEKQFDPGVGIDQNLHRSSSRSSCVNGLTLPLSAPTTPARVFLRLLFISAM